MKRPLKKVADTLLPEVKDIATLLPEMVRIASEGGVVVRIAKLMLANGWTEQDVWREIKRLSTSNVFTTQLLNTVRDITRSETKGEVYDPTGNWARQLKDSKKFLKPRQGHP